MGAMHPQSWSVVARNLAEHARNPIHTDDGARAAGFPGALVAGVTTYAYLCHPLAEGWGPQWLSSGAAEVRFRAPVFADDRVDLVVGAGAVPDEVTVGAVVGGSSRAEVVARRQVVEPPGPMRPGEALVTVEVPVVGEWADYGERAGDPLVLFRELGVAHPAVWPALANHVVHTQVARGSWIHTRSRIVHEALVPLGAVVEIRSVVVERFVRSSGERAVLDVELWHDGRRAVAIEHEAIVALPGA